MKDSDRYFTSVEILALVAAQWPDGIDLDPCWDPESIVVAKTVYDIRAGQDGLILPWPSGAKVWLNPPYSRPEGWLQRAAQHAHQGGEVLALVLAAVGASYWRRLVWPMASVAALSPRPKFTRPKSIGQRRAAALQDHAVIYWGPHHDLFASVWAPRGEIVNSRRLAAHVPTDMTDRSCFSVCAGTFATDRSVDS